MAARMGIPILANRKQHGQERKSQCKLTIAKLAIHVGYPPSAASRQRSVSGGIQDFLLRPNEQTAEKIRASSVRLLIRSSMSYSYAQFLALPHPGDHGFLAAVLPPGMRAVTIAVDNLTGANGLIWPGDNVDVLMTQTLAGAPDAKSMTATVVLSAIRVIATGAVLVKDSSAGPGGGSVGTVTLEVTPEQASRCIIATNLGRLSLIVHSAQGVEDKDPSPPPGPVFSGDVSQATSSVSTVNVITSGGDGEFKF
jgi:pilus assembly protein CpaB